MKWNAKSYIAALKRVAYYYPFRLPGTALFVISLVLLYRGYTGRNEYDLAIGFIALVLLLVLAGAGRVLASRVNGAEVSWGSTENWYADGQDNRLRVDCRAFKLFPGYRMHAAVRGTLEAARRYPLYVTQSVSGHGGEQLSMVLRFPLSGQLRLTGTLSLHDMFGLTRARSGPEFVRNFTVFPGPFTEHTSYEVRALGGFEDESAKTSSDAERYYMREYVPGDRLRDINWKATSRLSQPITRVAPQTQEKTQVVPVEFRHYAASNRTIGYPALVHLDRLKSWMLAFLRQVKKDNPNFQFQVRTADGDTRLESEEDIDHFAVDVSRLGYETEPGRRGYTQEISELYVFTTPYDENLQHALASYRGVRFHLFRTIAAKDSPRRASGLRGGAVSRGAAGPGGQAAARRASSLRGVLETVAGSESGSQSGNSSNRDGGEVVRLLNDPTLTAVPGPWVIRRERNGAAFADRGGGTGFSAMDVREHAIAARLV